MSYPRYLEYKESGIEWLGKIPAHWEIRKLRFICKLIQTGKTPPTSEEKYYENVTIRWFSPSDFTEQLVLQRPTRFLSSLAVKDKMAPIFGKGSLMIVGIGATTGKVGLLEEPSSCNQQITGLVFKPNILPRFAGYFFKTQEEILNSIAPSATLPILNNELIANLSLPFPPKTEQQKIVDYIEIEIKRLDKLIAAKERLLDLLAEKRRALITHAVTRGLNADVPMRDSGVEWLGEIPKHWKVLRLKFLVSKIGSGKTPLGGADTYVSKGIPLIRSQNVHFEGLSQDDLVFIDHDTDKQMTNSRTFNGDVLLNITGASIGRCCLVPKSIYQANVNQHVCVMRPLFKILNNKFLKLFVESDVGQAQVFVGEQGISREGLTFEQIGNFVLSLPLLKEQEKIVAYIETQTKKLDLLKAATERTISLLKERRASLIAAAVTGQIAVGEQV